MIDRNLPRWIVASIAQHYSDNKDQLTFYLEGEEQKTSNVENYFELRINGPLITETSGFLKLEVVVNLLIVYKINKHDLYQIQRSVGTVVQATGNFIPVYKYGAGGSDDQSFLGCLCRCKYEGQEIMVSNLGQIDPDVKEMQSVVQAYYRMLLEI